MPNVQLNPPTPDAIRSTRVLDVPLHLLEQPSLWELLTDWLSTDRPRFIITANALFLLDVQKSPELMEACRNASLILPDSTGITWAARRKAERVERLAGIDLAYQLCGLAELKATPIYLLGGASGVAERAADWLHEKFPYLRIAGMRDGFFKPSDEAAILKDIAASKSKVVLIALGMPRQELWISERLSSLPPAIYIGVGGTFDVWAGDLKRAPAWMQKVGLEWLYRWIQQPWRWNRMIQLPKFAYKVVTERGR